MRYYAELPSGERLTIDNTMIYEALVRLHGWYHVFRDTHVTVIKR